jgi:carboxylate-amine ligase
MCDIPMRVDETICLAALMQAVVVKLYKLMRQNLGFRIYRRALINENKWRAARYGTEGKLIDFGKQEEVDFKILAMELVSFISDVVDDLGSWEDVNYILQMLQNGTGADRQLAKWDGTEEGLKTVVDYIIDETHIGLS